MSEDYRTEYLTNGVSVLVSDAHRFGTDAVLLADFAIGTHCKNACDLGTGCGIIPFLWLGNNRADRVTGVEIQRDACDMTALSITRSGAEDRFTLINADLRALDGILAAGTFDVVTMNPPYRRVGHGVLSESDSDRIARHETMCTLEEAAKSGSRLLKFGGRLCMCHRPDRLCDMMTAFCAVGCEPKRLRLVQQRTDSAPWLVLLEGKRGARPGLRIEPTLIIEGGHCEDDLKRIYGAYAK